MILNAAPAFPHRNAAEYQQARSVQRAAMRTPYLAALILSTICACSPLRMRADNLLHHHQYVAALEVYDGILARNPNDAGAAKQRERARLGVMLTLADQEWTTRETGQMNAAMNVLLTLLDKTRNWPNAVDASLSQRVDAAVHAHRAHVTSLVRKELARGAPGAAHKVIATRASLFASPYFSDLRPILAKEVHDGLAVHVRNTLARGAPRTAQKILFDLESLLATPGFSDLKPVLTKEVHDAGVRQCNALIPSALPSQPYWSWFVSQTCEPWGIALTSAPRLPLHRSDLIVEGLVSKADPSVNRSLIEGIHQWFKSTPWYDSRGRSPGQATLSGEFSVKRRAEPVHREQAWTEQVPYQATETYEEPYQVPYEDTEQYAEQVPYTEQETHTHPCPSPDGHTRRCRGTRTVTKYRTEYRNRIVTRYRTEYRTLTRQVTKYRPEPGIFVFDAVEHSVSYHSRIRLLIDRGAGVDPFPIIVENSGSRSDISHDVEFAPANVHPRQAAIPTDTQLFQAEVEKFRVEFVSALRQRYLDLHCSSGKYDREEASRCAYGQPEPMPEGVAEVLLPLVGPDLPLVVSRVRVSTAGPNPPKSK